MTIPRRDIAVPRKLPEITIDHEKCTVPFLVLGHKCYISFS